MSLFRRFMNWLTAPKGMVTIQIPIVYIEKVESALREYKLSSYNKDKGRYLSMMDARLSDSVLNDYATTYHSKEISEYMKSLRFPME